MRLIILKEVVRERRGTWTKDVLLSLKVFVVVFCPPAGSTLEGTILRSRYSIKETRTISCCEGNTTKNVFDDDSDS